MSVLFPLERYGNLEGWIPTTDVDGMDINKKFLSNAVNVDFENGLWENARKPAVVTLPTLVQTDIDNGYELLSTKKFTHSERGNCTFYFLYKFDTEHLLKYYIKDDVNIYTLNVDEVNDDITVESKPTKISYNFADDQLKINLNTKITYNAITTDIIGNLTLLWSSAKSYRPSHSRVEGWYLTPRWLGWQFNTPMLSEASLTKDDFFDNFEDPALTAANKIDVISGSGTAGFDNPNSIFYYYHNNTASVSAVGLMIKHVVAAKKISFAVRTENTSHADVKIKVQYWDIDGNKVTAYSKVYVKEDVGSSNSFDVIEVDLHKIWQGLPIQNDIFPISADPGLYIYLELPGKDGSDPRIEVDYIKIEPIKAVTIAVNEDGQRGTVSNPYYLPIQAADSNRRINFEFPYNKIDWRISSFEIYAQSANENIYYKVLAEDVDTNDWVIDGSNLKRENLNFDVTTETINFNYGLGATVRVFSEDENGLIGDYIYSEIFYRNRSYYVKSDNKLYLSHISGTGRAQPDSFPYSFEDGFGYLVVDDKEVCLSLAITALSEVTVRTKANNYVYVFEYTSGTPFRRITTVNGGQGIFALDSTIEHLDGKPLAEFLLWADKWGIYAYAGGRDAPKNILEPSHQEWWNKISNESKENAVACYYKPKNEYWLQVGESIMVFEMTYRNFRVYQFDHKIKEFVGIEDDILYYLGDDNKLYKYSPANSGRLSGWVETHFSTNYTITQSGDITSLNEIQDKILQEIYLLVQESKAGYAQITIIADDIEYSSDTVTLSTGYIRNTILAPLLIRYGKIKLRVHLSAGYMRIKEFGYSFSEPTHRLPMLPATPIIGIGMEVGGEHGVVW